MNPIKLIAGIEQATGYEMHYDERSLRHCVTMKFETKDEAIAIFQALSDLQPFDDESDED